MIALSTPIVARIAAPSESNDAAIECSIRISSLEYSATCVSTMLAQGEPCRCPPPKSRRDYWLPEFEGNCKRDRENSGRLRKQGWEVLVVRECQIGDEKSLEARLERFLSPPIALLAQQPAHASHGAS